eukprot:gnl/TRDRNA2_/TRDRNA2_186677_c0_seq1.p1 gnl/TRDRNA2_/TRDRNA2_186677_c0~~gnl/TRDRNA2_/TRDRNA2_186677_c0_seq1.p1  ORF type:complete len:301 (+),score=53.81 gnl/TRDRNA2_/TRDRNA2_186677_c0_seq1:90-992(+)
MASLPNRLLLVGAAAFVVAADARRLALRQGAQRTVSAAAEEVCSYEIPADAPAGENAEARHFIEKAYGGDEEIAHLPEPDIRNRSRALGPAGPDKCREADADGNCKVASCKEDTYGEITQRGAVSLLSDPHVHLKEGEIFFDLGCGLGKMVADAAILMGASRSVGVELSDFRWKLGCEALGKMASKLRKGNATSTGPTRHMELRRGDMLRAEVSTADVVYVASLCFRPALMESLRAELVQKLRPGVRVASLRRFPDPPASAAAREPTRLTLQATLRVVMSWNDPKDPNPVYVYSVEPVHR